MSKSPLQEYKCPAILFTPLYREPGSGDAVASALMETDPEGAGLMRAFLLYYRGSYAAAAREASKLLKGEPSFITRLGVSHVLSLDALFTGDVKKWQAARELIAKADYASDEEYVIKQINLATLDSALFVKSTFPAWFREGCFEPLPFESYGVARYLYAKLLYIDMDLSQLAAVVEPFISQSHAEGALLSEIYLRIIAAMGRYADGDAQRAEKHLRRALALALPDRIYAPFAEYRRNLGPVLDRVLKDMDPAGLKLVVRLNEAIQAGWTVLYNALYDKNYTNDLTHREYDVARFALLGMTNGEIAERMGVSVNTVKLYLRNVYEKLGVNRREALAPYIWDEL